MKLTNGWQEVTGVTKGTYQLGSAVDVIEVAISDITPTNGVTVYGGSSSMPLVRNFDTQGSKLWVRGVRGSMNLIVVPGFL